MRRVIIILVLLAAVGAAGWFFMFRAGGGGTPPAIAAQLDKENTIAFASVEQPDALLGKLLDVASKQQLPAEAKAGLAPEARTQAIGFDPATAAGWQSVGIDAKAGVGVALDARIPGRPFVIAKITDEAKFLAWLGKQAGGEAKIADGQLTAGTKVPLAIAKRGAFTLIGERIKPAELKAVAEAKGAPLTKADGFDAAFTGAVPGGRVTAFAPVANLTRIPPFTTGVAKQSVEFYAQLFPAIGGFANADDFRVRVATTEKGMAALKQLVDPGKKAPAFAKWLPAEGFAAVRYSVNLKEMFTGLQALLPPAIPEQVRMQLGMAPMALSFVGIDWNVVTEAFTGHVALAIKPDASGGAPAAVVLLGLGNGEKAEKLLDDVQGNVGKMLGMGASKKLPVTPVEIDGAKGRKIAIGPATVFVVRKGDMLVCATGEQLLKDTLARAGGQASLAGTPAGKFFDSEAVFAATANIASMLPPSLPPELSAAIKGLPPITTAVRLDRHGLAFEGQTVSLAMGFGMAVFNFMQRMRKVEDMMKAHEAERDRALREAVKAAEAIEAAPASLAPPAPASAPASAAP